MVSFYTVTSTLSDRVRISAERRGAEWKPVCKTVQKKSSSLLTTIVLLFFFLASQQGSGQFDPNTLDIFNIQTGGSPLIEMDFYATDVLGDLIRGLEPGDVVITENGQAVEIVSIDCPPLNPPPDVSLLMAIDNSRSMDVGIGPLSTPKLTMVKNGVIEMINRLPTNVTTAITSFSSTARLVHTFSQNLGSLAAEVQLITTDAGTDYDAAFRGPNGGLTLLAGQPQRRAMILISDGEGNGDLDKILELATDENVTVYTIYVGDAANPMLRLIADSTGGYWFETNGVDEKEFTKILTRILFMIQDVRPCHIVWKTIPDCEQKKSMTIRIPAYQLQASDNYELPAIVGVPAVLVPWSHYFNVTRPDSTYEKEIILTAPFDETEIFSYNASSSQFDVKEFEENPGQLPLHLNRGDSLHLTIRYHSTSTGFVQGTVQFIVQGCPLPTFYIAAGVPELDSLSSTIHLTHPDGGEEFLVESDTYGSWEGVAPTDQVRLDYSIDAGATWNVMADRADQYNAAWHVPNTPSRTCLARVTHLDVEDPLYQYRQLQSISVGGILRDGMNFVTVGSDDSLTVWEIGSGRKLVRVGVTSLSNELAISPNGRHAVIGSLNGVLEVVDLEDGKSLYRLKDRYAGKVGGRTHSVLSYFPDGYTVLSSDAVDPTTVTALRKLTKVDLITGKVVQTFDVGSDFIYNAIVSPDGKHVVAGGRGGAIVFYDDLLTGAVRRLTDSLGDVQLLAFSRDGSRLYSASTSDSIAGAVTVWDVKTGDVISRSYFSRPVNTLEPFLGEHYLISDREGVIRTDSGETFRIFASLSDPMSYSDVTVATGHMALPYVMTIHNDNYVRFWPVHRGIESSDVSDSLWAIVAPDLETIDVDFGRVYFGDQKDSTVTIFIRNNGSVPVPVEQLKRGGTDASDFTIISPTAPFEIPAGGTVSARLQFKPGTLGTRRAFIDIITPVATLRSNLTGEGIGVELKFVGLTGDFIDFGKVPVGKRKDSTAWAVNIGVAPISVESLVWYGPDDTQFSLVLPNGSAPVKPGDSIQVDASFRPLSIGKKGTSVGLVYHPVAKPAICGLIGEGTAPDPDEPVPFLHAGNLDFGLVRCDPEEKSGTVMIVNGGGTPLQLDSVLITGAGASNFVYRSPSLPVTVQPGDSIPIEFIFTPIDPGSVQGLATLHASAGGVDLVSTINLTGRYQEIVLATGKGEISLGNICTFTQVPINLELLNRGSERGDVSITATVGTPGMVGLQFPQTLSVEAGETIQIPVTIASDARRGSFVVLLSVVDQVCNQRVDYQITGEIVGPEISIVAPGGPFCPGDEVLLTATGGVRYEWSEHPDIICGTCETQSMYPTTTTRYIVTGYNAEGCSGRDTFEVRMLGGDGGISLDMGTKYRGLPGDQIPIDVTGSEMASGRLLTDITFDVTYDQNVINLVASADELTGRMIDGTLLQGWSLGTWTQSPGHLTFELLAPPGGGITDGESGRYLQLQGTGLMDSRSSTDVRVEATTGSSCIAIAGAEAEVTIDPVCGLNFRLIEFGTARYGISPPAPNPVRSSDVALDFSLGLDGPTRVVATHHSGTASYVILEDHLQPGEYHLEWRDGTIVPGLYLITITSGDWRGEVSVMIVE